MTLPPTAAGTSRFPGGAIQAHRPGQRDAAAVDAGLHGSDGDVQHSGDLLVRQVLDVGQDQRHAVLLGDQLQRARDVDRIDRGVGVIGDRRAGLGHLVVLIGDQPEHGLAATLPQDVVAGVDGHAVEPRRERGLAAELRELAEHRDERILRGVPRVLGVAQDAQGNVVDPRLVTLDERHERLLVPGEEPADEVLVAFGLGHARQRYRAVGPLVSVALTFVNCFVKLSLPARIVLASLRTVIVTVPVAGSIHAPFLRELRRGVVRRRWQASARLARRPRVRASTSVGVRGRVDALLATSASRNFVNAIEPASIAGRPRPRRRRARR